MRENPFNRLYIITRESLTILTASRYRLRCVCYFLLFRNYIEKESERFTDVHRVRNDTSIDVEPMSI